MGTDEGETASLTTTRERPFRAPGGDERGWRASLARIGSASTLAIAFGAGLASLAMNFWVPFLPLYMLELGAGSDPEALFWVGVATTGTGIARLVSGPAWGVLSDRFGRKVMFVRALYFATATTLIAALATEPWHVAMAFTCQGLFSGFIPAAVALTSVTVPDSKLSQSLGLVTGAQYLGNTVGPAIGAGLAVAFGLRGAIAAAAVMPAIAATLVIFLVPRDIVRARSAAVPAEAPPKPVPSIRSLISVQLVTALVFYFFLFAMTQLVRLAAPLAIGELDEESGAGAVGVAFTLAGIASVAGVLVLARRLVLPGRFRQALLVGCVASGAAHVLLALAANVPLFVLWFSVISLLQAAMLPASNTLIASAVPRSRRGTAFGFAGSAQALAFMVGPMTAAGFAAVSMDAGFVLLGALFVVVGVGAWTLLKEPRVEDVAPAKPAA